MSAGDRVEKLPLGEKGPQGACMGGSALKGPPGPPDRVAEIRARLAAATPGPWRSSLLNDWTDRTEVQGPEFGFLGDLNPVEEKEWEGVSDEAQSQVHRDAEFIAHSPDDVAFLLAEVDRLRSAYKFLEENQCCGGGCWDCSD